MENGLLGPFVTDNHVAVTEESRCETDCDIPCLNFDHVSSNIRHNITAKTVCDRKPNGTGKCDA